MDQATRNKYFLVFKKRIDQFCLFSLLVSCFFGTILFTMKIQKKIYLPQAFLIFSITFLASRKVFKECLPKKRPFEKLEKRAWFFKLLNLCIESTCLVISVFLSIVSDYFALGIIWTLNLPLLFAFFSNFLLLVFVPQTSEQMFIMSFVRLFSPFFDK